MTIRVAMKVLTQNLHIASTAVATVHIDKIT
jgi:hypothetical protein